MKAENWTKDRLKIELKPRSKRGFRLSGTLPNGKRIRLWFAVRFCQEDVEKFVDDWTTRQRVG